MGQSINLLCNQPLYYEEYGNTDGYPLLFFHGIMGSHRLASLLDGFGKTYGYRILAPDRPGMGHSGFQPDRRRTDWGEDMRQLLAAENISSCGVIGLSAGGPYALTTLQALPEQVRFAVLLSGWFPVPGAPEIDRLLHPFFRLFRGLGHHTPWAQKLWARLIAAAYRHGSEQIVKLTVRGLPPSDRALWEEPDIRETLTADIEESFRQGWRGPWWDAVTCFEEPDPALLTATRPVALLHGTADTIVRYEVAQWLASHLPHATLHTVEGGGHFCAFTEQEWLKETLDSLRAAGRT